MVSVSDLDNNKIYDLAIIGGGINGAGIALDAALRGLSVVLVEKNDFGSATTSASTKLIHGGLRYLEYFEFPLVRESLGERERLLNNAKHLVFALKLNIPLYKESKRGIFMIKAGMILYDLLSFDKTLPNHKMKINFNSEEFKKTEPSLNHDEIKAIASYYDCQVVYPERLCLELILSAVEAGAIAFNHTEFFKHELLYGVNRLWLNDSINKTEKIINARVIVNAAGPYVDRINKIVNNNIPRMMGGTKGSHILVNRFEGGPNESLYVEAKQDGRPFFIIPWREYYLVGTTDKFYDGNLDEVTADPEEIEYLLNEINFFITSKKFTLNDVLYTYSGIRPLPYEPGKTERQVTRKHIIYDHEKNEGQKNYLSIIGGKLTTYRSLAEDAVDLINKKLGLQSKTRTSNYPLIGSKGINKLEEYIPSNSKIYSEKYDVSPGVIEFLISIYGSKFKNVLLLISFDKTLKENICPGNPDIGAQVAYAVVNEMAKTLEDIMRRTGIGTSAGMGINCAEAVAGLAAKYLKWNEAEIDRQVTNYKNKIKNNFKIEFINAPVKENKLEKNKTLNRTLS